MPSFSPQTSSTGTAISPSARAAVDARHDRALLREEGFGAGIGRHLPRACRAAVRRRAFPRGTGSGCVPPPPDRNCRSRRGRYSPAAAPSVRGPSAEASVEISASFATRPGARRITSNAMKPPIACATSTNFAAGLLSSSRCAKLLDRVVAAIIGDRSPRGPDQASIKRLPHGIGQKLAGNQNDRKRH